MDDWCYLFGGTTAGVLGQLNSMLRGDPEVRGGWGDACREDLLRSGAIEPNRCERRVSREAQSKQVRDQTARSARVSRFWSGRRPGEILRRLWQRASWFSSEHALPDRQISLIEYADRLRSFERYESKLAFLSVLRHNRWMRCPGGEDLRMLRHLAVALAYQLTLCSEWPLTITRIPTEKYPPEVRVEMLLLLSELATATKWHATKIGPTVWQALILLIGIRTGRTPPIQCLAIEAMQQIAQRVSVRVRDELRDIEDIFPHVRNLLKTTVNRVSEDDERRIILASAYCLTVLHLPER